MENQTNKQSDSVVIAKIAAIAAISITAMCCVTKLYTSK